MNDLKALKEKSINNYISNMLLSEDIDVNNMKRELGVILGEIPGIELNYETESLIVENDEKAKRIEKLESINIYYSYEDDGVLKFGTLTYLPD